MTRTRILATAALVLAFDTGVALADPASDSDLYQRAARFFNDRSYREALPLLIEFSQVCGVYEANNPGLCNTVNQAVAKARKAIDEPIFSEKDYIAQSNEGGNSTLQIAQVPDLPTTLTLSCEGC